MYLGFGDKNLVTGEIDDLSISNNGDSEKYSYSSCNFIRIFRQASRSICLCDRENHGQGYIVWG